MYPWKVCKSGTGEDAHKVEATAYCNDRNITLGIVCLKFGRAIYVGKLGQQTFKLQYLER